MARYQATLNVDDRVITLSTDSYIRLVQNDRKVMKLIFTADKIYGPANIDLSTYDCYVYYSNVDRDTGKTVSDIYVVTDTQPLDDDKFRFGWVIGANASKYAGKCFFQVVFKRNDSNNVTQQQYESTIAQIEVAKGLEDVSATPASSYADLIAQITAGTVKVDPTLTISGQAADAKVVGDKISALIKSNTSLTTSINSLNKDVSALKQSMSTAQKNISDNTSSISRLNVEMTSLKKSVSDGKSEVATAITEQGVATSATDSFHTMAVNILQIDTGGETLKISTSPVVKSETLSEKLKTKTTHQKAFVESDGTVIGEDGSVIIQGK